jgi:hypothetical protein
MDTILILIILLVIIYFIFPSKEGFDTWPIDYESVTLSPIAKQIGSYQDSANPYDNGFYGHKGYLNPMDASNYANTIAADLQHGFANPINRNAPAWDPASYRLVQGPGGEDYGMIESN